MTPACARSGVWGLNLATGELRPFPCGSPRHDVCAPQWARRLRNRVTPLFVRAATVFDGARLPDGSRSRLMKFGTLTLPPEVEANEPSFSTIEADAVAWRRFRSLMKEADAAALGANVLLWKREVGERGGRLHRHLVVLTHLPNRVLWRLARRSGYGLSKFKLVRSGAMAARYVGKYVAKPDLNLSAWPARTRWAQTKIRRPPRVYRGRWLSVRVPRFASERAVLSRVDALLRRRAGSPVGVCPQGDPWSPLEDGAWAPIPPPRGSPPRSTRFGGLPRNPRPVRTRNIMFTRSMSGDTPRRRRLND